MRILFLTSRLPFPPIGGDKLRTFHFIKYLNQKHELHLISFIEDERECDTLLAYREFFNSIKTIKLTKFQSYFSTLCGLVHNDPLQIHYYSSKKMHNVVKNELKKDYDAVFCHLIRMAQYLPNVGNVLKVIDFTDAISLNYQRSRKYRKGVFSLINSIEADRVLKYEKKSIEKSDFSIFISKIDSDYVTSSSENKKIKIIDNGVDLKKYQYFDGEYDSNTITFIGNMRTFPNTDAVIYFIQDVFPLIKNVKSQLKFYIVGTEPNKTIRHYHNNRDIIVTGFVDSVIPYIQNSAAVVAPMRVGAGVQNKILESLALGTPVVTTPIGAEGLDHSKLTIGKNANELSRKTIKLLESSDLRKKKSEAGLKYIKDNFTWDKALKKLDDILK